MTTDITLHIGGFKFEPRCVVPPVSPPSLEEFRAAWEAALIMADSGPFYVGDLAEYGAATYGDKYTQLVTVTGYAVQTLMNAAYVARAIPPERRRPMVPFAQHAEVASLPPADQDKWLDRCETEHLTRRELRAAIREPETVAAPLALPSPSCARCAAALEALRTSGATHNAGVQAAMSFLTGESGPG